MNHLKIVNTDDLLKHQSNPRLIESQLTDYIMSLRNDGVSYSTIKFLVFAQNESEMDFDDLITDSKEDQVDITLTNGSEVQVNTSGVELPQQQPQVPLSPSTPSQQQPQGPLSPSTPSQQQPQGPLSPPQFNRSSN